MDNNKTSALDAKTRAERILTRKPTLIIAHRGFSQHAPENTLPAFELALSAQADLVEFDVRSSRDGELVVIHDHELDRTTDAVRYWQRRRNRVHAKPLLEIRKLDAGAWFDRGFAGTRIPTLSEAVCAICKHSVALIERKAGNVNAFLSVLRDMNVVQDVVVQSFDWDFLRSLHQAEPRLILGALGPAHRLANGRKPLGISRRLNRSWLNQMERTGARIAVWNRKLSQRAVKLAHQRGLKVWVYTVDDPRLARRMVRSGVDGLITNSPVTIQRAITHL